MPLQITTKSPNPSQHQLLYITMKFSSILALTFSLGTTLAAGPINVYITKYNTIEVVETATTTVTEVVQETHYV